MKTKQPTLKKVLFVQMDEMGEPQAMFSDKGELLHMWFGNDGNWRGEYFDTFIEKLGYEVIYHKQIANYDELIEKLKKHIIDMLGYNPEE